MSLAPNLTTPTHPTAPRWAALRPARWSRRVATVVAALTVLFLLFDAVIHLAELSNDPLGQLAPNITFDINHGGSMHLANTAIKAGVKRFVYFSSCSVYGASPEMVDELIAERGVRAPFIRLAKEGQVLAKDCYLGPAGFGAEIAAVVADEAFTELDAPVSRLTMPDIPSPHNAVLLDWAVPSVARIRAKTPCGSARKPAP